VQDPLILRDASTGDLAGVANLLEQAYAEHERRFPPAVWATYRRELAAVGDRLAVSELIVGMRGGELVGTVTFYPQAAADGHDWPPGVASLRLLAVRPGARGAGVGAALVAACIRRARAQGAAHLGLHTASFMEAANRLYARLGFVRAPHLDFDADVRYGGAPVGPGTGRLAGAAYLLPLEPGRAGRDAR